MHGAISKAQGKGRCALTKCSVLAVLWDKLFHQLWLDSQLHIHIASAGVVTIALHCSHTAKKDLSLLLIVYYC